MNIRKWVDNLSDQKPYYLAVIDDEGRLTFANSQFYSSFQAPVKPDTQHNFFDLVHENDRPELNKVLASCSLRDEAVVTEIRVKSGHFRWVKWEISGIRKPDNMSGKFLCLGYDVAKEEQRERTLRAFEENYRPSNALFLSFMDHTASFAWIVDEEGALMFGNRSFLEYFRLDQSAFGKELTSLLPAPVAGTLSQRHKAVFKSDRQDSIIAGLLADGSGQLYHITVFPIRGNTPGRLTGGEAHCL